MRRAARIAGWSIIAVIVLVAAAAGAVLATAHTAPGRRFIERWTPRLTGGLVRISGLAGSLPDDIELGELDLSDDRGVWLSAEHVSLRWSPLDLIGWRVQVASLEVGRLRVLRPPQSPSPEASSAKPSEGGGPSIPRIDVGRFSIGSLVLDPAIAGSRAVLTVSGNAHLRSLDEATARFIARRTNGEGDYELDLHFDRSSMRAAVKLEEPASGPLEHLARLPGLGALSVEASLSGPHDAERVRLDARVGALSAKVLGTVDLTRRAADLTYSIESPAITPRPGVSWRRLSLEGRWRGPLDAPSAAGRFLIDGLELPGGTRLGTLAANLSAASGAIEMQATVGGLVLPGPAPRLFAGSPVRLDATLHLSEPRRPLDLTARQRLVSLTARALTAGARSATFDVRIPDIAPFAALARLGITGGMTAQGRISEDAGSMRVELAAATDFSGRNALAKLLGGPSRVRLSGRWRPDALDIAQLEVKGDTLFFSGSGRAERLPSTTVAASGRAAHGTPKRGWRIVGARWQLSMPHLSVISPALNGTLAMTGEASGPITSLATRLRADSTLSVHGSPQGTIDAVLETHGLPPALTGTLQAQGLLDGAPLALDASVDRDRGDDLRHLIIRRASWKSVRVDADVTSGPHLTLASGKLDVHIDRLADLQPLIGRPLEGHMTGSATFTTSSARTLARLDLDARGVATQGLPAADMRLSGSGPLEALPLALSVRIANLAGGPASLEASVEASVPDHGLTLERITAHYRGATLTLLTPARLSLAGGLEMSAVRLGIERAVLELSGEVAPALDLHASLTGVDAKLVDVFEPGQLASGTMSAAARLTGTLRAPQGRVTVTVDGLRMAASAAQDLPAIDARLAAQLSGTEAEIDARLGAGKSSRMVIHGSAPLGAEGRYGLQVSGSLDAALANPLLEAHGQRAAGTLTVDATVSGPARDPEIGGALELAHGDLRDYGQGLHFGDITGRIVGGRGILRIASLTARAGPGTVSVSGTLGVLEPHLPIDVELVAKNAEPIQSDLLTTRLDADIRVEGSLRQRIDVSGKIHVDRAQIGIPNGFPPNVAVLDVRWPGETPPPPPARRLTIGLDLALDAPRGILVQGRGLDAELGGNLKIGGTTRDPQVRGGFHLIMGTFSLASTQLRFSSGLVSFTGAGLRHQIDPTLDFVAQATAANATVTLRITGFADAPTFELSSAPKLPQDEILARLLFGESAAQLTGLQVAEIGAALASLSGIGGGNTLNPLARVQKALGLDRLTVGSATTTAANGTTQSAGASITAGRYVSSRVFVSATQNTTGTSQLKVDIDLTKHLKLQTRLGNGTATAQGTTPENDPGSSIGLSYQFDY